MSEEIINLTGISLEKYFSNIKHLSSRNKNLIAAVLIDAKLLRHFDCGQIDLCTIERSFQNKYNVLKIYEIKSQPYISKIQLKRLNCSAKLLSEIFDISAIIEILYPDF